MRGPRRPAETALAWVVHGRAGGAPPTGMGDAGVHPHSPRVINNINNNSRSQQREVVGVGCHVSVRVGQSDTKWLKRAGGDD